MLLRPTFTKIDFSLSRDWLLEKTFKITDIAGDESIFLKDNDGREFVLNVNKDGRLQLDQFQSAQERIEYLEDMVVTLLEKLNIDEEQIHDATVERLYGDTDYTVVEE